MITLPVHHGNNQRTAMHPTALHAACTVPYPDASQSTSVMSSSSDTGSLALSRGSMTHCTKEQTCSAELDFPEKVHVQHASVG